MIPVTAIILTQDEEINIGRCIEALSDFAEIVVVDSGSQDSTLTILSEQFPKARTFRHDFLDFGQQRNWAIDSTSPSHDWILFIDADEFMTPSLAAEIDSFVNSPADATGAFIAGKNYFLGSWLKHCTYFPSYQLRLLRRGSVRYQKEGHGQREITEGKTVYLKENWRHEGFSKGIHQWVARHNDYSSSELELISRLSSEPLHLKDLIATDPIRRRRALKRVATRVPGRAIWQFLYSYIFRLGFLDGRAGFLYCQAKCAMALITTVKTKEARMRSRNESK